MMVGVYIIDGMNEVQYPVLEVIKVPGWSWLGKSQLCSTRNATKIFVKGAMREMGKELENRIIESRESNYHIIHTVIPHDPTPFIPQS